MKYWIDSFEKNLPDLIEVGGKGFNLFKLTQSGINVPHFGVVSSKAHSYWKEKGALPPLLIEDIQKSIARWGEIQFLAIRSSMSDEDGESNSFAGILESYLYKKEDEIEKYIIECFNSLNSDRAVEYAQKAGLKTDEMSASVVIQVMVNSESSGVAFSRSPLKDSSLILVESCFGIGEGLVSGLVEVDTFLVDRFKNVIKRTINEKESGMFYDKDSGELKKISIPKEEREVTSLKEDELTKLINQILVIEEYYKHPVDIEWAFENGQCHILQTRPITQNFKKLEYYVDTNLSESYPGLTSPFTGSVIPKLYEKVFLESAEILGASKGRKEELSVFYKDLVKYIHGHLYYHLDSYYQALCALPGGEKNIDNWHRMIGGKLDFIKFKSVISPRSIFEDLMTLLKLLNVSLNNKSLFSSFYMNSKSIIQRYEKKIETIEDKKSACANIIELMNGRFNFGLTVVNDILIMIFLSLFEKLAKNKGVDSQDIPSYLKTDSDVESIKPIIELNKFVKEISNKEHFFKILDQEIERDEFVSYEQIENALIQGGMEKESRLMNDYLNRFGDRAFEELKFECLTFSQSPKNFNQFLKWYSSSESTVNNDVAASKVPDGFILKWVWRKLHEFIASREGSRLERARFYNLLRDSFLKFIYLLRKEEGFEKYGVLDFFSLRLDDIQKYHDSNITLESLKDSIETNKNWQRQRNDFPEFLAFDHNDNPWFMDEIIDESIVHNGESLKGDSASQYDCEGEALVLSSPQEAFSVKDLSDKILITKTTDPAWVFIMSKCRGLISEKGSLLSHTAIIGRELSLPTIVGVKNATKKIKSGQKIKMISHNGEIQLI